MYSQHQNIIDSSSCRSCGTILLYKNSICTDRDLTLVYFASPSYLLQNLGDFIWRKYCKYSGSIVGCTKKTGSIKRANV